MAEDRRLLDLIVKESCCSLTYNDHEQRFSFPFVPALDKSWLRVKNQSEKNHIECTHYQYNEILHRLDLAEVKSTPVPISDIFDSQLLAGEIVLLEFTQSDFRTKSFMKMSHGEYLDLTTGMGVSLGDHIRFCCGETLITSEGELLGIINSCRLLCPTIEHVSISKVFFKDYYKHQRSESLWELFEKAKLICQCHTHIGKEVQLIELAVDNGADAFILLNIVNAAIKCVKNKNY